MVYKRGVHTPMGYSAGFKAHAQCPALHPAAALHSALAQPGPVAVRRRWQCSR